jgi:hypothetical protein
MTNEIMSFAMTINTGIGGVAQFAIPFSLALPVMAIKYSIGSTGKKRSIFNLIRELKIKKKKNNKPNNNLQEIKEEKKKEA